jgi:hypothetical protein
MPQNDPAELSPPAAGSDQPAPPIDVQRLAEKIVELLKREAHIERERTGRR